MNRPTVSIGLPVYNGEQTIGRALASILSQDFEDFEFIISDNASTDDTARICESYARQDKRVRFVRNATNIGAGPNHNRLVELAKGKYFSWAAHDVEYLPGMLSRCVEVMKHVPASVVLAYPLCETVDDRGQIKYGDVRSIETKNPRPCRRFATVVNRVWIVTQFYGLVVTEALRKTRLIDSFASSDYVLLAELAMLGEIREIPEVLTRRTLEPDRGAAANREKNAWAAWLDPRRANRRDRLTMRDRLVFEYLRSAWRLPLNPADKLLCLLSVPVVCYGQIVLQATRPWRHKLRACLKTA